MAGSIGGPPGLLAGALLGSAVGAAASIALGAQDEENLQRDQELDREIGVIDGNIGEASPNQPPSQIGAFSTASMGVSGGDEVWPSEGPIPNVDED